MLEPSSSRSAGSQSDESEWVRIGAHRYCIEGDVVFWRFSGHVTLEHVQRGMSASDAVHGRYGYCLTLMDAGAVTEMAPAARRYLGERSKAHQGTSAAAIFNAGLIGITISHLIAGVTRLLSGRDSTFCIVKTESEARQWLHKQRQRMQQGAV